MILLQMEDCATCGHRWDCSRIYLALLADAHIRFLPHSGIRTACYRRQGLYRLFQRWEKQQCLFPEQGHIGLAGRQRGLAVGPLWLGNRLPLG